MLQEKFDENKMGAPATIGKKKSPVRGEIQRAGRPVSQLRNLFIDLPASAHPPFGLHKALR